MSETIEVGNICVFKDSINTLTWKIGRVLQFSFFLEKTKSSQQYRGTTCNVSDANKGNKIGVLCAWYTPSSPTHFSIVHSDEVHTFFPVTLYVCTLSHGCFADIECTKDSIAIHSVMGIHCANVNLATAKHLTLTSSSLSFIESVVGESSASMPTQFGAAIIIADEDFSNNDRSSPLQYWTNVYGITLTKKDLYQIVGGKELSDLHVNAFQNLVKSKFPHIGGLQSTLLQKRSPLNCADVDMSLQIIHTRRSHWAALQFCDGNVYLYDSAYMSISTDTLEVIAQLMRAKEQSIKIHMMNIAPQLGRLIVHGMQWL